MEADDDDAIAAKKRTPDQEAAHAFLTELRTRIAIQPLYYQQGIEQRALESLYELFALLRTSIKAHPGCEAFAQVAVDVLNTDVREVTAKWHRASEEGRLLSRDGGDEFRADLAKVRARLRTLADDLSRMAYDTPFVDRVVAPPIGTPERRELLRPLPYGVPPTNNGGIDPAHAAAINASERAHVGARRRLVAHRPRRAGDAADAVGLALSGGGIRSATFCLGVVQVLADKGLLRDVDFLSTVSGGGYTGSFLTMQLSTQPATGAALRTLLGAPHGPDPAPIRTVRQYAKFLMGGRQWTSSRMALETLLGMFMNWTVPLFGLTVAAAVLVMWRRAADAPLPFWPWGLLCHWLPLGAFASLTAWSATGRRPELPRTLRWVSFASVIAALGLIWPNGWPTATACAATAFAVAALGFFATARARCSSLFARFANVLAGTATVLGALLAGRLVIAVLDWALPCTASGYCTIDDLHKLVMRTGPPGGGSDGDLFGGLGTWLGAGALASLVPTVLRFAPLLEKPGVRTIVLKVCLWVAGIVVPVIGLAVFGALVAVGSLRTEAGTAWGLPLLEASALLLFALATWVLDINVTSPHRLYRRGLARTFVDRDKDRPWPEPLATLDPDQRAPYHLINATLNLPRSDAPQQRDRRSDFFVFSKHWSGSPVVGYHRTIDWYMAEQPCDLASAMAISGAAVSSSMGLGSIPSLRALLTLLNVRLGYWIANPRGERGASSPGFVCLLKEMTGYGMDEQATWLNLSDGGHIENLGIYELLRRRCKFIVAVDGEADPDYQFHGLMTLVRHAQIDFGAEIACDLTDLRPDATTGVSRSHYHLCRIRYPADANGHRPLGLLLYLKLSMTGNEPELIRRYRADNPTFPHQSTLDQFFDEAQFEAYRELGVHVAEGLFAPCLMDVRHGARAPRSIRSWFERLARNLLEPAT